MTLHKKLHRTWQSTLICLALLWHGLAAAQTNVPWPSAPFSYYAEEQELVDVLREFAGGFSLALQAGQGVSGRVNGRFTTDTPTEFLNRLGGVYGFNWFTYAGTLYVSRASDIRTEAISTNTGHIGSLRQALQQMGLLDPRFGWGELPEQGLALISGPPTYIDLIKRTVATLPDGDGSQEVAVFRLRHASVNDRVVRYRDTEVTTPGVASILRGLLSSSGDAANDEMLSSVAAPLRDNPPTITETDTGVIERGPAGASVAPGTMRRLREPTVQADSRLNAIIIQDIPSRIPLYRQLIEQLDVPSTLIEIEAMIVDVNAEVVDELGVTWGARSGDTLFGQGDLGLSPSGALPISPGGEPLPGMIGVSVGNSLVARLRALEGEGDAQILSQPSILTADNLGAMIDLSETFYIQTRGERVAEVTPVTVGTSLRVTPRYIRGTNPNQVELTVDIEDGRIQDERQIDNLPTVRKSNVSTLAVVSNAETLLIGGYNSSHESERIDKVPLLGDIPGVGVLFSNRARTWQRRERLFLIRPRVVAIDGVRVVQPTSPERLAAQEEALQQIESELQRKRPRRLNVDMSSPKSRRQSARDTGWVSPLADEFGNIPH